jgi:hypothetical protein
VTVVQNPAQLDGHELIAESPDVPIERETLDVHVGHSEDGRSWSLITSTGLDTDESVLDDVNPSDTVLTPEGIKGVKHVNGIGVRLVAVRKDSELDGKALFELDGDLIRGAERIRETRSTSTYRPEVWCWVLEDTSLIRNVEQVLVRGPWLSSGLSDWNLLLGGVFEQEPGDQRIGGKTLGVRRFLQYTTLRQEAVTLPGILHGAMTLISGFNP